MHAPLPGTKNFISFHSVILMQQWEWVRVFFFFFFFFYEIIKSSPRLYCPWVKKYKKESLMKIFENFEYELEFFYLLWYINIKSNFFKKYFFNKF